MPTIEETEMRLRAILVRVLKDEVSPDTIQPRTRLVNAGLSIDSVTLLEFVLGIENEFQIALDDSSLTREHFETLGSLARAIHGEIAVQWRA